MLHEVRARGLQGAGSREPLLKARKYTCVSRGIWKYAGAQAPVKSIPQSQQNTSNQHCLKSIYQLASFYTRARRREPASRLNPKSATPTNPNPTTPTNF